MINQQLKDYIDQQRGSGITDQELERRLTESGWPETEVKSALGGQTDKNNNNEESGLGRFDLNSPGVYELGLIKTEANASNQTIIPVIETTGNDPAKENKQRNTGVNKGLLVFLILLVILGLGAGFWYISNQDKTISPEPSRITQTESKIENVAIAQNSGIYENKEAGFGIKPPTGWKIDTSGTFGTLVVFTNVEPDSEGNNKFTANMNVVAEETQQTPDEYLEAAKNQMAQNFTEHVLVSEQNPAMADGAGGLLESTFVQGVFKLHNLQLVKFKNGKAFVVTTVCLDSYWEKYRQVFTETLNSFVID